MSTPTTPVASDRDALLAACRLAPDEDTPRLLLADWLDEQGDVRVKCQCRKERASLACKVCGNAPDDSGCLEHGRGCYVLHEDGGGSEYFEVCDKCENAGTILDTSNRDRAELIRVQCELARTPACSAGGKENARQVGAKNGCSYCTLRCRESAILVANPDWLPVCPVCGGERVVPTINDDGDPDERGCECFSGRVGSFDRGLLSVPVPTLTTIFVGTGLDGFLLEGPDTGVDWSNRKGIACDCRWTTSLHGWNCPAHGKPGRPVLTAYARALRAAHPWVVSMPVADREPCTNSKHDAFFWFDDRRDMTLEWTRNEKCYIPAFIYDRIQWDFDLIAETSSLTTPELATRALGSAVAQAVFA